MADPQRSTWRSILTAVPLTSPDSNVSQHPRATLQATESRIVSARQQATMLHMQMQQTEMQFKTTIDDIEKSFKEESAKIEAHYHEQVDSVQAQYKAAMDSIRAKYREAYAFLRAAQKAYAEQAKHIDFKGEFIDHFPEPTNDPDVSSGSHETGTPRPRT